MEDVGSVNIKFLEYGNKRRCKIKIDKRAISAIKKLDGKKLFRGLEEKKYELCGGAATVTTMLVAKKLGGKKAHLLKYANSGDVPFGNKFGVVGYAEMIITTQ